jgi:ubiquinone/menaquinone biosynthesis C-methylase UbiE
VLHHTTDPERGLHELYRVLKPGGVIWLFLYGKSLWWDMMDVLRKISFKAPHDLTHHLMRTMGYAPNRVFKFLDSLYVPIIESYPARQVETRLRNVGFKATRQLPRCVEMEHFRGVNEMLWHNERFAAAKWGAGELRYLAQKPE